LSRHGEPIKTYANDVSYQYYNHVLACT